MILDVQRLIEHRTRNSDTSINVKVEAGERAKNFGRKQQLSKVTLLCKEAVEFLGELSTP
jgi:hypothetical protein